MISEAAYLEAERRNWLARRTLCRAAKPKHEFWAGTVRPVLEPEFRHAVLVVRAQVQCNLQLQGSQWSAVSSSVRVYIETPGAFVYPDVLIGPRTPAFYDDVRDTIMNPRVLIEIVSASTREHDRGPKLLAYRTLLSLTDYVLVAEDEIAVEHHQRRVDGVWRCVNRGPGSSLVLESIDVDLAVDDLYRRV